MAVHTFYDSTCSHGEISAQTLLKDIAGSLLARLERVQEKTITYHLPVEPHEAVAEVSKI